MGGDANLQIITVAGRKSFAGIKLILLALVFFIVFVLGLFFLFAGWFVIFRAGMKRRCTSEQQER